MTDIAKILQYNVIGKLLNHVLVFLINIFIARYFGASGSGPYFNELYLLNFIVFIFSAGLDYSAISILAQEPKLLPVIHRMLLKLVLLFSVVILLYAWIVLPVTNRYFNQPALAIILFSIGNLLLIFYQGILSATRKFNHQNIILFLTNLIFLLVLVIDSRYHITDVSALKTVTGIHFFETAYACLFFIQGLLMWAISYRKLEKATVSVKWNVFIRSGIFIMASSLVYFAFLRIDNFFVQKYTDDVTLGNYVQCGKIGQYFLYFSSVISSTLLPFISSESVGSSFSEWKKIMRPYIILLCLGALVIVLFGQYGFPLIFGPDFTQMYSFMIILLPGFICLGMLTLINAIYIGKGNIRKIFRGDLIGLIIVTGFDAWLVPRFGAYAAAIISSAAYCIVFIYLVTGFRKQFSLPVKKSTIIEI